MPRHADVVPKTLLKLRIPLDLRARLDLHLTSDLEGRVPYGNYSTFFEQLLRDFFNKEKPQ